MPTQHHIDPPHPTAGQLARMSEDEVNATVTDLACIDAILADILPYAPESAEGTPRRFEEQEIVREWDEQFEGGTPHTPGPWNCRYEGPAPDLLDAAKKMVALLCADEVPSQHIRATDIRGTDEYEALTKAIERTKTGENHG